jgi:hypothetical protein
MLDARGQLLYVGKASNIKRRLDGHSRGAKRPRDVRAERIVDAVAEVRWIVCPNEREAHCLEADLIVAFVPPFNASMATEVYTYLHVAPGRDGSLCFSLEAEPSSRSGRVYGGFPHLGKGRASWRGKRTNAGYSALTRLLWVTFADDTARTRIPARLRGTSPPVEHRSPFADVFARELHDFLSGRSARILKTLRARALTDDVPTFMRNALADDVIAAEEFHVIGPRRLRQLRTRHRLPPGPLDEQTFVRLVVDEAVAAVGPFASRPRPPSRTPADGRRRPKTVDSSDSDREH